MIIDGNLYVRDRDAFKTLIVSVCVAYSAVAIPFYEALGSPSLKAFPTWIAYLFLGFLLLFGLISMVGIIRLDPRMEGHGMLGLCGIWVCFGVLGISTSGGRATAFASFLFAFSAAAAWTWWQKIGRPWWQRTGRPRWMRWRSDIGPRWRRVRSHRGKGMGD